MTNGWAIGYVIGAAVVAVVALVVLVIIGLARRIAGEAEEATRLIQETRDHTEALWRLGETQQLLAGILVALRGSRSADAAADEKEAQARLAITENRA